MKCVHFRQYMAEQERHLRAAIEEEKWYLSEQAGCDVGFEEAMTSFMQHHIDRFAHDFRVRFCRESCSERGQCPLAAGVDEMLSSRQLTRVHGRQSASLHCVD